MKGRGERHVRVEVAADAAGAELLLFGHGARVGWFCGPFRSGMSMPGCTLNLAKRVRHTWT